MLRISYLLFGLLLLSACRPSLDRLPEDRLHFGNAGGITGSVREYVLFEDSGKLLLHESLTDEVSKVGKLDKVAREQFFQRIDGLTEKSVRPGNYNSFFRQYRGDKLVRELQWSSPNGAPDEATQQLFEDLMTTIRTINEL